MVANYTERPLWQRPYLACSCKYANIVFVGRVDVGDILTWGRDVPDSRNHCSLLCMSEIDTVPVSHGEAELVTARSGHGQAVVKNSGSRGIELMISHYRGRTRGPF